MSFIPDDNTARKMLPLLRFVTGYFPKALREACKVSVVNNVRYNPDRDPADINWARGKSPDQLGSAFRHIMERLVDGKVFEEVPEEIANATGINKVYILAEAFWRVGAALELEIEKEEAAETNGLWGAINRVNQSAYAGERGGTIKLIGGNAGPGNLTLYGGPAAGNIPLHAYPKSCD